MLQNILYIICLRKWLIIIPPMLTCMFAVGILVFVEPIYVSSIKVWNKEHQEGSTILQVVRNANQKDVYANVQREIIRSGAVLDKVLEEQNLINPPPSNSIAARLFKYSPKQKKALNQEQLKIQALTALQKNINVDIINPEVLIISAKMNNPELAYNIVKSVAENYKKTYLDILNKEINECEEVLQKRLDFLQAEINRAEKALQNFEDQNPDIIRNPKIQSMFSKIPESSSNTLNVKAPLPSMSSEMTQVNPITVIIHELSRLEMSKSRLLTQVAEGSEALKEVNAEIERNKKLLTLNTAKLSKQARLAIQHQRMHWTLNLSRERYTALIAEYDRITLSRGTKKKQIGSISVLDAAIVPLYPIYPKKKMIVIAAGFLGILTGLACVYLAHIADSSYHLSEELRKDLKIPILAVIPKKGKGQ